MSVIFTTQIAAWVIFDFFCMYILNEKNIKELDMLDRKVHNTNPHSLAFGTMLASKNNLATSLTSIIWLGSMKFASLPSTNQDPHSSMAPASSVSTDV